MKRITIKVDFKGLLEDIVYTNMVSKAYDVSRVISRNQYYDLKDSLIHWLLGHKFSGKRVDGFEYVVGKDGERIELVKLTITYGGSEYMFHQKFNGKMKGLLGIESASDDMSLYQPEVFDGEYDESRFAESIRRMMIARIRFMRSVLGHNGFGQALGLNRRSNNPWMAGCLSYLPHNGVVGIDIEEMYVNGRNETDEEK